MTLTHSGLSIPRLGLGTWQLTGAACDSSVRTALDLGYRHIDTAQAYENEVEVGAALAASGIDRADLFLTTKVWRDRLGDLAASVEQSLDRLKTDYVDLLLIHWPVDEVPLNEQLDALAAVHESGKARLVGVSNFTVAWLDRALAHGVPLATNQVEYHAQLSQEPVLQRMRQAGMFLTAYSPLGRGRLLSNPIVTDIAAAHNAAPSAILLAWLLHQPDVVAIPKATGRDHLKSNFEAQNLTLSASEMDRLATLRKPDGRMINPSFSPTWDTGTGQPV